MIHPPAQCFPFQHTDELYMYMYSGKSISNSRTYPFSPILNWLQVRTLCICISTRSLKVNFYLTHNIGWYSIIGTTTFKRRRVVIFPLIQPKHVIYTVQQFKYIVCYVMFLEVYHLSKRTNMKIMQTLAGVLQKKPAYAFKSQSCSYNSDALLVGRL